FAPLVLATRGPEPNQRSKMREEPVGLVHLPNRRAELLFCNLSRIRFEHPGLRLDHLTEGPEAHPFAVCEGAAVPPPDELRIRLDGLEELVDESALADAGLADKRHELRRAFAAHTREGVDEHVELAVAPDERRAGSLDVHLEPRARLHRLPHGNRFRFPLGIDGIVLAVLDRSLGC